MSKKFGISYKLELLLILYMKKINLNDSEAIQNVKNIEQEFLKINGCGPCSYEASRHCHDCNEVKKVGTMIDRYKQNYSSWEIAEGISNACDIIDNRKIFSAIILNYFFFIPSL